MHNYQIYSRICIYLYKCICQPTLTYDLECMGSTAIQMRRLDSAQGKLIKQSLGLSKLSHNTALLTALNIEKIEDIVNRNVLSLYNRIFKVESPARRLMQHLLSRFICYGEQYLEPCWIGWYLWASHQANEPLILNMYPKLV